MDLRIPYDQKFYLESMLHKAPDNAALLQAYFNSLTGLSQRSFGLMHAALPGCATPLFFRGMTSDVPNMEQIFGHAEYGFRFAKAPRRILDLGAYVGYAAVYFANRF